MQHHHEFVHGITSLSIIIATGFDVHVLILATTGETISKCEGLNANDK